MLKDIKKFVRFCQFGELWMKADFNYIAFDFDVPVTRNEVIQCKKLI